MDSELLGVFHNETLFKVSLVHPVQMTRCFVQSRFFLWNIFSLTPNEEVDQVDDISSVVEDHPHFAGHHPEDRARDDEENIIEDGNSYHLKENSKLLVLGID